MRKTEFLCYLSGVAHSLKMVAFQREQIMIQYIMSVISYLIMNKKSIMTIKSMSVVGPEQVKRK